MTSRMIILALAATFSAALVGCDAELAPLEEARDNYFASVTGSDDDCSDWLQWCIDEGYPQVACEERNQYCEDGQWMGADRDDERPDDGAEDGDDERPDDGAERACSEEADEAYDDCIDGGGTAEACGEVAEDAYVDCMGE